MGQKYDYFKDFGEVNLLLNLCNNQALLLGNKIIDEGDFFVTPERVVLYFGINFFLIPVIKVVKILIKQKTRENSMIHGNHLKRSKNLQEKSNKIVSKVKKANISS